MPSLRSLNTRAVGAGRRSAGRVVKVSAALKDGDLIFAATEKQQGMWLEMQGTSKEGASYAHAAGYELRIDTADADTTAALLGRVALPAELWSRVRATMGDDAVDALKAILTLPDIKPGSAVKLSDLQPCVPTPNPRAGTTVCEGNSQQVCVRACERG
jgi:hypothetical protein